MAAEDWIPDGAFEDPRFGEEDEDYYVGYYGCVPHVRRCNRCGKVAAFKWTKVRKAFDGRIKEVWHLAEPNGELHVCDPRIEEREITNMFEDHSHD